MEPEWLTYLREHAPLLAAQAQAEMASAVNHRDELLRQLGGENACLRAGAAALHARVEDLQRFKNCVLDEPEDRLWHAQDRSWWRYDGDRLLRAECPIQDIWAIEVRDPEGYCSADPQVVGWRPSEEQAREVATRLQGEARPCEQCGKLHTLYDVKALARDQYLRFQPEGQADA